MNGPQEYLELARRCDRLAARASCEKHRQAFQVIASRWRDLAALLDERPPEDSASLLH